MNQVTPPVSRPETEVVVVPAEYESQFVHLPATPKWPLALAGILLVIASATSFLAWQGRQTRAAQEAEIVKLTAANRELNDQNAQLKLSYDQQLQAERDRATTMATQAKLTETSVSEWNVVQGGLGGVGYQLATPLKEDAVPTVVSSSLRLFRLDFALPKVPEYPEYSAELTGPQGQRPVMLKALRSTNGVSVTTAMAVPSDGKYTLKLFGKKDGQIKEIGKGYAVLLGFPK